MKCFAIVIAICFAVWAGIPALPTMSQNEVGKIVRTDPAIDKLIAPGTKIDKVHGGFGFTESPYGCEADRTCSSVICRTTRL